MKTPILSEQNYQSEMERIRPLLAQHCTSGSFERVKGEAIHYELYQKAENQAWVAISHGFTENTVKYRELIWYFLQEGYNVAMVDHRGHGRSFRDVSETWLTSVEHFDDYSDDFAYFLKNIVEPVRQGKPLFLMSHSMGGAVAAHLLQRYPELPIQKAVLGCPMISPATSGLPKWGTRLITSGFSLIGKGKECVFVHHPYTPKSDFGEPWCCASSFHRHEWYWKLQQEDPLLQNCSASYFWLREALKQTKKVMKTKNCQKIRIPVLLLQGEKDNTVENSAQDEFIAKIPGGKKVVFPNALHEIFRGDDAQVERYMDVILEFFRD